MASIEEMRSYALMYDTAYANEDIGSNNSNQSYVEFN
jgi:hypothetical protein